MAGGKNDSMIPYNVAHLSAMQAWQKRMEHERKRPTAYPFVPTEDPFVWTCVLRGPVGSLYEGAEYAVELRISKSYPFEAPYAKFRTPIYHANIHESGQFYCPYTLDGWSPSHTLHSIMVYLENLLGNPTAEYGYNYEASLLFKDDPIAYRTAVCEHVKRLTSDGPVSEPVAPKKQSVDAQDSEDIPQNPENASVIVHSE
jgi:ubiquitin-protein ligase